MKYVLITLLLLVGLAGSAQQTTESNYRNWIRTNNTTKSKIALVIGNSKYQYTTQLTEPSNDANELANALNAQGYEVLKAFNLDRRTLVAAISDFAENFGKYEEGVIYYAGHGFQVNGINYLVPTDANPSSAWQVEGECINVRYLLDAINQPNIPKLILVDACRNNPFAKSWSGEGRNAEVGMRAVQALSNSIVIFSTAEQTVVRDNNPFAETFARHIQLGGCVEGDIIGRVAVDISRSNPNQLIRPTGFLFNNICFGSVTEGSSTVSSPQVVESPQTEKTTPPAPDNFIRITGGTFAMGCQKGRNSDCDDDEKPRHAVTVSTFYFSKYEVTQAEWREVMGSDPPELHNTGCDQCPVDRVSWDDIQDFLQKLNTQTGQKYRLPTEAEWEYAARGGNKSQSYLYSGSNTIDEVAWYNANSMDGNIYGTKKTTHPVGRKKPNELGLYDMSGNVWEWCSDWYLYNYYKNSPQQNPRGPDWGWDSLCVNRGGSWSNYPLECRTANRGRNASTERSIYIGFRLARTPS